MSLQFEWSARVAVHYCCCYYYYFGNFVLREGAGIPAETVTLQWCTWWGDGSFWRDETRPANSGSTYMFFFWYPQRLLYVTGNFGLLFFLADWWNLRSGLLKYRLFYFSLSDFFLFINLGWGLNTLVMVAFFFPPDKQGRFKVLDCVADSILYLASTSW